MFFFGIILTGLVTLLHIYVFGRLASFRFRTFRISRKILLLTGIASWLLFVLGRLYGGGESVLSTFLDVASMHWMGSLFLIAAAMFVADVSCGFGLLFRKRAMGIRMSGVACGVALVIMAHVQGLRPPRIETREAVIAGLSRELDGTTVAVMADLHVGEMMIGRRWLTSRIEQVQALQPDCIVLVGDLFERGADPEEMAPVMRRLSAPLGVWAVRGNHDALRPRRRDVTGSILEAAGIRLLGNEWAPVTDGLLIAGIDDLTASRRRPGEGEANLERALANRPETATILLSHTPWMVGRSAALGVDLMLSGHTHNGQIWPFNYLVRTRYPYITGIYDINGMALVVSRGTGTWGPRMRLWAPGQITLISLRSPMPAASDMAGRQ